MSGQVRITVDERGVALLRLDRPEARNALAPEMMEEIAAGLERLDADPAVRCIVVAGSDEVFAAGADVRALSERSFADALRQSTAGFWRRVAATGAPTIAAVSGYALGGGFELALCCDMIVASETAQFGLPEVTLGIIPGGGGGQRLARVIGKQRAMEFVLTGRRLNVEMAVAMGIVNRQAKKGRWLEEALELAATVAERPPIATRLGKRAVLAADETGLAAGIDHERRLFELAMATEDRVEGMRAFLEKREPRFEGR